ncbi:MAG: HlyD family efflux transporter periplasmic adaptor subunit [Hydrogenophaga sp.]|nr:HlyD family efflux transporter periplasmic adaptor subunit [Hydrogenophaga sp.]
MTAALRLTPDALPPLRGDLQLRPAAAQADGSPAWVIQDPVTNQFYRIGWLEFELLSRWHWRQPERVLQHTAAETLLAPTKEELEALCQFLQQHHLLEQRTPGHFKVLHNQHQRSRMSRFKWALHHYLFFRLPLFEPAAFLRVLLPWLSWVYRPATGWLVLATGAVGLLLTSRQWDSFTSAFAQSLSWEGALYYLLAMAVAKSVHELGHALTATRYGVRVAHMGVAFLVMWPMLYTDTTESWRLSRRRQRLAIASAGVIGELALAGAATLAWNLVADGPLRDALFFLATTAWIVSLTINLSPFMRFDGYFVLSDAVDLPNLHERASAVARASIRRGLLGLKEPDPEPFAAPMRRFLVIFAWITWIYRLVVFVGIAVAVYLFFFKVLGILLFLVEIWWFIMRPVIRETQHWFAERKAVTGTRRWVLGGSAMAIVVLGVAPWQEQVKADGWALPEQFHVFHSPLPAQVLTLPESGKRFAAGETVLHLDQPELGYRGARAAAVVGASQDALRGLQAQQADLERVPLARSEVALRLQELQAELTERDRLVLNAPFAGTLVDLDPELMPGTWVSPKQPLASLVGESGWIVEAFVQQADVERLSGNSEATFYPVHQPQSAIKGTVIEIARTRTSQLPNAMLAAAHGGPIPIQNSSQDQELSPRDALYRVKIRVNGNGLRAPTTGTVKIKGKPRSLIGNWLKPMLIVLLREFSF